MVVVLLVVVYGGAEGGGCRLEGRGRRTNGIVYYSLYGHEYP